MLILKPVKTGFTTDTCYLDFETVNPKAIFQGLELVSVAVSSFSLWADF